MTHMLTSLLIATLLATSYVAASGLTISGVYYDPVQAESGGEALSLENTGLEPVSLSTLVMKSTRLQLSATLLPGQGYLIADTGWSTLRDNLSWPEADLEASLSLPNTEGFVEILSGNESLDMLAWNNSNGSKAREGYMWTHRGEATPYFMNSSFFTTNTEADFVVEDTAPTILSLEITDDAPAAGVQLLSYNRTLRVSATLDNPSTVTASLFGKESELEYNGSAYVADIAMTRVQPGKYYLVLTASSGNLSSSKSVEITVLGTVSIVASELAFHGAANSTQQGNFSVENKGNVAKTITVRAEGIRCEPVVVQPQTTATVSCVATMPAASQSRKVKVIAS